MDRRSVLTRLVTVLGGLLVLGSLGVEARPRPVARHRRRVRRRIRRRIRRRVIVRTIAGRPFWVVPVGLAIGWELMHEGRIVVVKETKIIEAGGVKTEVAIVQGADGKTEQVSITREDTADNRKDLGGSVLPEGDKKTPAIESEIEEDE